MEKIVLKRGYKGERNLKNIIKVVFCMFLIFTLSAHWEVKSVLAKETSSAVETVKEEPNQTKKEKTIGEKRAEELAKMPLSGKSPIVYAGLVAGSMIVLGVMISIGKSLKKKDTFV